MQKQFLENILSVREKSPLRLIVTNDVVDSGARIKTSMT